MEKRREKNFGQVGGRLAAKASLVQREVARRSRDGGIVGRYYDLVLSLFCYGTSLWSPGGGVMILRGAKPVRLATGAFLLLVCVVAGFAPYRVAIPMG